MEGNRGINFRALGELFRTSETRSLTHKYTVSVSVLEIYNENVRDLLCSEQGKKYLIYLLSSFLCLTFSFSFSFSFYLFLFYFILFIIF